MAEPRIDLPVVANHAQELAGSDEVRWCPGCGDYSVLAQLKKALTALAIPREQIVFVAGIGCSSRLPYYLNTYGFHTIHGRAPAIATGLQLIRPELSVWVITGDGDGLSTGTSHLLHALRRNPNLKILLFNNEVHGLTRGQYSPTSRPGTLSRTSPEGSTETPLQPVPLALTAGATFVARTMDVDVDHLTQTLMRAGQHRGVAFVEILQNCKVFNDGVFEYATDQSLKGESVLFLEQGQPLRFGPARENALRYRRGVLDVFQPKTIDDPQLLIHDETDVDSTLAYQLGRLTYPDHPECFGVFRAIDRPTLADLQAPLGFDHHGETELGMQGLLDGDENWVFDGAKTPSVGGEETP